MPQVVAAVKWAVAAWQAFAKAYAVLAFIVKVAAVYAISRALTPRASLASLRSLGTEVNVRDPAAPRQIIYGQRRVSGVLYPVGTSGTNNEYLHLLLLIAGHEVEELGDIYFNDQLVTLDGSGNATGTYAGFARIKKHLGAYNQTVDTDLQTDLGAGTWTSNHKLGGIAYLYLRLKHSPDLFAGIPEIYCVVKGRKVYDPRAGGHDPADPSTWTYSANAALCLLDWVRGVPTRNSAGTMVRNYGVRAGDDEIDTTAASEAANICDEDVVLDDLSTENRYESHGLLHTSVLPGDGIEALKSGMAGECVYVCGKWVIRAGAYRTPTVTLTDSDLRAPLTGVQVKPSRRELCNGVKGVFISSENNWQPSDFPPVTNATYYTEDGSERLWHDIELPFTKSPACAQRLGKIILERSRQTIAFTARCKLTALRNQVTDVVQFTHSRFGWTAKAFEVVGFALAVDTDANGVPYLGCDLTLRETASGVWDWADGEETVVDLAPNTTLPNAFSVPTPGAPTLTSGVGVATQQSDGTILNRLKVAWTAPTNEYVRNGGHVWIEYKKTADSDWISWTQAIRGDLTADYITDVKVGISYDVRIRFENQLGVRGAYSSTSTHTVTAAPITPTDPTAATKTAEGTQTGTDGSVTAYLTFTVPALPANAAKQFLMYKRNGDTDWLVAAGPLTNTSSATVTITDLLPGVSYAIATLALSSLDVASNYVAATSSPFTAPTKSGAPSAPTNLVYVAGTSSSFTGKPVVANGVQLATAQISWDEATEKDFAFYEWAVMPTNTAPTAAVGDSSYGRETTARAFPVAANITIAGYFFVRSVNSSGIGSSFSGGGTNLNSLPYWGLPAGNSITKSVGTTSGTVAAGDDTRITGAAQKSSNLSDLGSASTARSNLGVTATGSDTTYAYRSNNLSDLGSASTARTNLGLGAHVTKNIRTGYANVTLSGGSPSESFGISLSGYSYSARPECGLLACIDPLYVVSYDRTSGSSTSSNAQCTIRSTDGSNIPATTTPIMFLFSD